MILAIFLVILLCKFLHCPLCLSRDVKLCPIRTSGYYYQALTSPTNNPNHNLYNIDKASSRLFTIYLSQKSLEVIEYKENFSDEQSVILCDVMPVIVGKSSGETALSEVELSWLELKKTQVGSIYGISLPPFVGIHTKDNGLYDNIPYKEWEINKKSLFDKLSVLSFSSVDIKAASPMKSIINTIRTHCNCDFSRLVIDTVDIMEGVVKLGGLVVFTKEGSDVALTADDKSISTVERKVDAIVSNDERSEYAVDCHVDELVALSFALNKPIHVDEDLFNMISLDAKLTSKSVNDKSITVIEAPLKPQRFSGDAKASTVNDEMVPQAWDIYDPMMFFRLSNIDKRNILRASGVRKLPKPREGVEALDRMLLDLMDDAVRGEIIRIQAKLPVSRTDTDSISSRQQLLAAIGEALQSGDTEKAEALREKFVSLTMLRADPTQTFGSYDRDLDQDDWYMQARKRALTPKKPTT